MTFKSKFKKERKYIKSWQITTIFKSGSLKGLIYKEISKILLIFGQIFFSKQKYEEASSWVKKFFIVVRYVSLKKAKYEIKNTKGAFYG